MTPITNRLAVPLVRGVVAPLLGDTRRARELFPNIEPMSYREAVQLALDKTDRGEVETRWSGALSDTATFDTGDWEGTIRETRTVVTSAPPERVFEIFSSLGGDKGWLFWDWAWGLRGFLDQLVGGPGVRRGRRDPRRLLVGDAVDFWRVEYVEVPHELGLRAEMKVPGKARLQWEVWPEGSGSRLVQTALFAPAGLSGLLYWYALYPVHRVMFSGLIREVARHAEARGDCA